MLQCLYFIADDIKICSSTCLSFSSGKQSNLGCVCGWVGGCVGVCVVGFKAFSSQVKQCPWFHSVIVFVVFVCFFLKYFSFAVQNILPSEPVDGPCLVVIESHLEIMLMTCPHQGFCSFWSYNLFK